MERQWHTDGRVEGSAAKGSYLQQLLPLFISSSSLPPSLLCRHLGPTGIPGPFGKWRVGEIRSRL